MAPTPSLPARFVSVIASTALIAGLLSVVGPPPLTPKAAAAPLSDARPGELIEKRTRTSVTTRQADGSLKTTVSAGAVHYRDGAGAWKRIDSALVGADEAGYAFRNKATAFARSSSQHWTASTCGSLRVARKRQVRPHLLRPRRRRRPDHRTAGQPSDDLVHR